jgi:AcrR family transcriptional regulator
MAVSRRRGVESSATRAELLNAAATLISEEGYAALTSRTLADRLNLSRKIVHYYFKSIDELWIALVQQRAAKSRALLEEALGSAEPLSAPWEICSNPDQAALSLELNALANRRPAVRAEVKKFAEDFRQIQERALVKHLQERGIEPTIKPIVATVLLTCLSQILALETQIDITLGHEETLELVDDCLRAFAQGGSSIDFAAFKPPAAKRAVRRQPAARQHQPHGDHAGQPTSNGPRRRR